MSRLLTAYLACVYHVRLGTQWHRLQVGSVSDVLQRHLGGVATFGVVTAFNPHSQRQSPQANRDANRQLHTQLVRLGVVTRPSRACATNGAWAEPGWLIAGIDIEQLDWLGRRFGQLGWLGWHSGEPVRLRMAAAPHTDASTRPWVDWLGDA